MHGPFDLIIEGTGYSPLVFDAMESLARNGVLVLLSVTGGDRHIEIPATFRVVGCEIVRSDRRFRIDGQCLQVLLPSLILLAAAAIALGRLQQNARRT